MTISSALAVQRHTDRGNSHHLSSTIREEGGEIQASLSQLALPGILVLNRDSKVIYQNLGALNIQKALAENDPSYFFQIVAGLYAEIKQWIDPNGCRPGALHLIISRVCNINSEHYLFRALPLYPQGDPSGLRHLLILFEPIVQSRIEQSEPPIRLTPREKRVVRLLLEGKTNKKVATCLRH